MRNTQNILARWMNQTMHLILKIKESGKHIVFNAIKLIQVMINT